ncbi:MAG: hypothetical protein L6R37_004690 [Teloschistes peruensis]|nr:MAG: hypothetical protein L6R37_004690 [Teloschistes peruensis]
MNEDFFARKGNENERRRADLPPSQGGKYAGFGSAPMPMSSSSSMSKGVGEDGGRGIPGVDEFQNDPVAALTKGFGWFTTTVGKSAKSVNDGWIQPNVQKLQEADLATQARLTAAQVAHTVQTSSKTAAEHFNRFVEDSSTPSSYPNPHSSSSASPLSHSQSQSTKTNKQEPERKDFWDSFGGSGPADGGGRVSPAKGNAIGTAAMRKGGKEKEEREEKWEDF